MRIIKKKNYDEVSRAAAEIIASQVKLVPDSVLGLATGSTPIGAYKELVRQCKDGILDFSAETSVNLYEYYGLEGSNNQSYRYFMDTNLFNHINIDMAKTNVPSGTAENADAECQRYEELISELGGTDLQLLGLGHNGHIGFNEPSDEFVVSTHVVGLSESTIEANKRFFESADDVPKKAITMGIGTIMKSKLVLLVVSGAEKADILKKALFGPVTPMVQASILQLHPNLVVVTDCEI